VIIVQGGGEGKRFESLAIEEDRSYVRMGKNWVGGVGHSERKDQRKESFRWVAKDKRGGSGIGTSWESVLIDPQRKGKAKWGGGGRTPFERKKKGKGGMKKKCRGNRRQAKKINGFEGEPEVTPIKGKV